MAERGKIPNRPIELFLDFFFRTLPLVGFVTVCCNIQVGHQKIGTPGNLDNSLIKRRPKSPPNTSDFLNKRQMSEPCNPCSHKCAVGGGRICDPTLYLPGTHRREYPTRLDSPGSQPWT